ncbi:MAG: hypothetical protein LBM00_11905 [Deltaproteobacteria bacterium]|jgi:S-formylglutathione hydrolase FrmB|nr:hypothetical protein [Deltaproteobacteria bacterium]
MLMRMDSYTLYRPVDIHAAVPHGMLTSRDPCRVIWALHCAVSSAEMFFELPGLMERVDKDNVAIVAPCLGNGFYINSAYENQADFLRDELLPVMRWILPLSGRWEDNLLLGISMGGFGAVRWALESPLTFSAVAAVSASFDLTLPLDERAETDREQRALAALFTNILAPRFLLDADGRPLPGTGVPELRKATGIKGRPPRIAVFCGERDYLSLNQSLFFAEACEKEGLEITLRLSPGGHNRRYWAQTLPQAAQWLLEGQRLSADAEAHNSGRGQL